MTNTPPEGDTPLGTIGMDDQPDATALTPFQRFGGPEFFTSLVADFYRGVRADPVLRPMYPEADLEAAEDRLRGFLEQYWGGPTTYSKQRGHPRLRMRHASFLIDADARDRWLGHMRAALDARGMDPKDEAELWGYLVMAAHAMVNIHEGQRPEMPLS